MGDFLVFDNWIFTESFVGITACSCAFADEIALVVQTSVPETVKATDLFMIAFVAEYNADVNARTILNANEVKLTDVVEIDPTSIEEATDVAFSVYPNPATDYAMISSNATIKEVAIINTVGQTVATFTVNAENVQINTQDLVKGVYMVSITTTEGSAVKSVIFLNSLSTFQPYFKVLKKLLE